MNQGELGDEMFIIVSGEVRVLVTPEHQKDAREVARRLPGDHVGEMAIQPRTTLRDADRRWGAYALCALTRSNLREYCASGLKYAWR